MICLDNGGRRLVHRDQSRNERSSVGGKINGMTWE